MTTLLYILIPVLIIFVLAFFLDWGHKDELELNSNIIGYGKAKGLYIIKMENYYVVAGLKVKSRRKAVKEFMHLVEENGFLPPGMYFKTFKIIEKTEPTVRTVKLENMERTKITKREELLVKPPVKQEQRKGPKFGQDERRLKPDSQKFRRR
jgi:hypothetical protein